MSGPIVRLSHIALVSPDVERLRAYYVDVVGLTPYDEADGSVYLASGGRGPALELRPGAERSLHHLGLELAAAGEEEMLAGLQRLDVPVQTAGDAEPGFVRIHQIADVEGNTIQLGVVDEARPAVALAQHPIAPNKIGHVATRTTSAEAVADFYETALGFRWSDWMGDFFAFLRCNADHHAVNFIDASRPGDLHHVAFELRDASHVMTACDVLAANGVTLVWGPGRHGIGHNIFTYHHDPDGNVVELFCDVDRIASEELGLFEPRPWHSDHPQRPTRWKPDPTSANMWGPAPPEDFMR
jgi:catechol-2,3-dioxygenase